MRKSLPRPLQEAIKIDGIQDILLAEQEADRIRAAAKADAEAALVAADEYRQKVLADAREAAAAEARRFMKQAELRAEQRRTELNAVTALRLSELERAAEERMPDAVQWLAERITEV